MPVLTHDVFTNQPGAGPYVIFPTHAHQILSNCVHIIGVSVLAFCFARRTENDRFTSWIWWSNLTWARLLIILVFLDSWFFLAFSGVLVNGVGLSYSVPVCSLGIFGCIFFYAGSKALTYLFLVERVWVVCSAGKPVTRRESLVYKGCAVVVFGYTAIVIIMILGRYANIRDDGVCIIGLHSFASIPLLTYDLFINIFLTSMFLWFLYREQSIGGRLRRLARRTAVASAIALTTSCVNILILSLLEGKQLGWVCLSSCAADVTVNALVLFWVTGGASREPYWHGAWEQKDVAYADPHDLPPLNFPVSFVADPEAGLSRMRTLEANPSAQLPTQNQPKGVTTRLVNLGDSVQEKEMHDGLRQDRPGHERWQDDNNGNKGNRRINGNGDAEDDDTSVALGNIEWDITDSASSGNTQIDLDDKETEQDKDSAVHSWRLTLDLELQRRPQPSLQALQAEQSEPDSPATHETGGSSARLTSEGLRPQTRSRKQRKEYKKQRRKQWHAATRPRRGQAHSRQRPASSPPATPHCSDPPKEVCSHIEPPLPPTALCRSITMSRPSFPQRTRRAVLRSHSDSLVRVSDPSLFPGRPRLSQ